MSRVTIEQVGIKVEEVIASLEPFVGAEVNPGAWTPAQTLDHLIQVHRGVLLGLRTKEVIGKRPPHLAIRRKIVRFILSNAVPVPAKGATPTCDPNADFHALADDFCKLHEKLVKRIGQGVEPSLLVMKHPVAGPLNLDETLVITHAHLLYHIKRAGK